MGDCDHRFGDGARLRHGLSAASGPMGEEAKVVVG
jgi:hypothetical protein